jgi:hypothetical protein
MSTGEARQEEMVDGCVLCKAPRPGRVCEFHYGDPSRGINPRTLDEDLPILGTQRAFVCHSCARRSLARAIRRITIPAACTAVATLLLHLASSLASGSALGDPGPWLYLFIALCLGSFLGALAIQVYWRRTHRLERELFDQHRRALAHQLGLKPEALHFYSSNQVANLVQPERSSRS